MKIVSVFPPDNPSKGKEEAYGGYGGIELVGSIVSEGLAEIGHDVRAIVPGGSNLCVDTIECIPEPTGSNVPLETKMRINQEAYALALKQRPDAIIDNTLCIGWRNDPENIPIPPKGTAIIHVLHGPAAPHLVKMVEELAAKGHFFISISNDQASRYGNVLNGQHLGTIYNPIGIDLYGFWEKPNLENPYFAWLARMDPEKGPHIAVRVSEILGLPLVMAARITPNSKEEEFFVNIVEPRMNGLVRRMGILSLEEKQEVFGQALALLMTITWAEPFGLNMTEAMITGTPVAGSRIGSVEEVTGDCGITVPIEHLNLKPEPTPSNLEVHEELARLIATEIKTNYTLITSPEFRRKCHERAKQISDPKKCVKNYENKIKLALKRAG